MPPSYVARCFPSQQRAHLIAAVHRKCAEWLRAMRYTRAPSTSPLPTTYCILKQFHDRAKAENPKP
eukprot:7028231-Pyramimonas_sp.AAC.1